MGAPFLRRDEKFDLIGEEEQADLVVIADGTESEQAGDFGGELALRLRGAAEISRGAHIHDQHDGEFAFFGEFFDKRGAHPRGDVPIDRANFVAGLILAHILEVHPASFEDTVVIAGEGGLDETAGFDFESADFLRISAGVCVRRSSVERRSVCVTDHGTGSPAKIRSITVSLVTLSASAS